MDISKTPMFIRIYSAPPTELWNVSYKAYMGSLIAIKHTGKNEDDVQVVQCGIIVSSQEAFSEIREAVELFIEGLFINGDFDWQYRIEVLDNDSLEKLFLNESSLVEYLNGVDRLYAKDMNTLEQYKPIFAKTALVAICKQGKNYG